MATVDKSAAKTNLLFGLVIGLILLFRASLKMRRTARGEAGAGPKVPAVSVQPRP